MTVYFFILTLLAALSARQLLSPRFGIKKQIAEPPRDLRLEHCVGRQGVTTPGGLREE